MSRYFIKCITRFILLLAPFFTAAQLPSTPETQLIENEHYQQLEHLVPCDGKGIFVVEFFSYGCPYCAKYDILFEQWYANKPADVNVIRIAIPRKEKWLDYAKLYYALEMISTKEVNRITPLLYHAIHNQKQALNDKTALINWAIKNGVDGEKLARNFDSKEVECKINNALSLAKDYHLQYVPSVFVAGKYQLILHSDNQYRDMAAQLDALIQRVRNEKTSNKQSNNDTANQ